MAKTLIRRSEGLSTEAYLCPAGKWTIGYGHTMTAKKGMTITRAMAEVLLDRDVTDAALAVVKLVPNFEYLRDGKQAALVDFVFNMGSFSFEKSTLLKEVLAGNDEAVIHQFSRWVYGKDELGNPQVLKGLRTRRDEEIKLWKQ